MSPAVWSSLSIKEGSDAASRHHSRGNGWKALGTPSFQSEGKTDLPRAMARCFPRPTSQFHCGHGLKREELIWPPELSMEAGRGPQDVDNGHGV